MYVVELTISTELLISDAKSLGGEGGGVYYVEFSFCQETWDFQFLSTYFRTLPADFVLAYIIVLDAVLVDICSIDLSLFVF